MQTYRLKLGYLTCSLQVRTAMADSNYFLFFKLYRGAPAMGAYLMDYCVDRLRKVALTIMTKVPASLSVEPLLTSDLWLGNRRCAD